MKTEHPLIEMSNPDEIFPCENSFERKYTKLVCLALKENINVATVDISKLQKKEIFMQPVVRKRITEIADLNKISFDEAFAGLAAAGLESVVASRKRHEQSSAQKSPTLYEEKNSCDVTDESICTNFNFNDQTIYIRRPDLGKLFDNQKKSIDDLLIKRFWRDDLISAGTGNENQLFETIGSKLEEKVLEFKKGHIKISELRKHSEKASRAAIEITNVEHTDYRKMIRFYIPISQIVKIGRDKYCPQWIFEEAKKDQGFGGKNMMKHDYYPTLTKPTWLEKNTWIAAHTNQFQKTIN